MATSVTDQETRKRKPDHITLWGAYLESDLKPNADIVRQITEVSTQLSEKYLKFVCPQLNKRLRLNPEETATDLVKITDNNDLFKCIAVLEPAYAISPQTAQDEIAFDLNVFDPTHMRLSTYANHDGEFDTELYSDKAEVETLSNTCANSMWYSNLLDKYIRALCISMVGPDIYKYYCAFYARIDPNLLRKYIRFVLFSAVTATDVKQLFQRMLTWKIKTLSTSVSVRLKVRKLSLWLHQNDPGSHHFITQPSLKPLVSTVAHESWAQYCVDADEIQHVAHVKSRFHREMGELGFMRNNLSYSPYFNYDNFNANPKFAITNLDIRNTEINNLADILSTVLSTIW